MNPKSNVSSFEDVGSPASPEQNDLEDSQEALPEPVSSVPPVVEYPEDEQEVFVEGGSMGIGFAEDADYLTNSQTSICSSVYGNSLPSRSPETSRDEDFELSAQILEGETSFLSLPSSQGYSEEAESSLQSSEDND